MLKKVSVIVLFVLSGCSSCVNNFYGTNSHDYLSIDLNDTTANWKIVRYYIDSVLNKGVRFPDSVKSQFYINSVQTDLQTGDRLVHFKEAPEEWYLLEFQGYPCIVQAIYNPKLSYIPIFNDQQLGQEQALRIKNRVKTEILDKAALYAREHPGIDSIVNDGHPPK